MPDLRIRPATRALVLDEHDRVLLVCFGSGDSSLWATPGGGIELGETDEEAIRRELLEETGLVGFEVGPHIWTRSAALAFGGWDGETERVYLVRTPAFEPKPQFGWDELGSEGVTAIRWWSREELEAAETLFAPRRLPALIGDLLLYGPPAEPLELGL